MPQLLRSHLSTVWNSRGMLAARGVPNRVKQCRIAYKNARIPRNIRRFQRGVDPEAVAAYRRPSDWGDHIEVVVPCYNHAAFLRPGVGSIASQTRKKPLTVTLVDDASTDNSLAVMRELAEEYRDTWFSIKVLANSRNRNQSGSLNRAVAESANALFVVLNADDLLTHDCLELITETYALHEDIALLGGAHLPFAGQALPEHIARPAHELTLEVFGPSDTRTFHDVNDLSMSQSSCSFFRGAWQLAGGYLPLRRRVCSHDDRDFQMRVCAVLPVGVYAEYPMEFYRLDSSQSRGTV